MDDPELDHLIDGLETRSDITDAEFEAVVHALEFLLPDAPGDALTAQIVRTTDGALRVADDAYPDWAVSIHGRTNDRNGHWRCSLRENDVRDNDAVIGVGRSPVLAQAILAALLRLAVKHKQDARPG